MCEAIVKTQPFLTRRNKKTAYDNPTTFDSSLGSIIIQSIVCIETSGPAASFLVGKVGLALQSIAW